jgi:hypothetical protein
MSAPVAPEPPPKKRTWLALFGINSLALSVLIHVLFGVGATYLIVQHFQKKHINFHATEPPAPHTEVEHKVQMAKRNNVESAPPDLKRIVTTAISPVALPDVPVSTADTEMEPSPISGLDGISGMGIGGGLGGGSGGGGGGSPLFGTTDGTGLKGIFYDLKQTPDRKSAVSSDPGAEYRDYYEHIRQYVEGGWKVEMLDKYYKSKTPLYSTRFAIPMIRSTEAPKAFNVENEVKPSYWAAHYQGMVSAPQSGNYRLMGYGDNVLIVRIDGSIVLDAGWNTILPKRPDLSHHFPLNWLGDPKYPHNAELKMGPPFHMDAGQAVPMEVLIGDDGGVCGFYLFVMKEGETYEKAPDGTPKLPFFELGANDPPDFSGSKHSPPFDPKSEPWQDCGNGDAGNP